MSNELLDLMTIAATGSICTIGFENGCPEGWQVTVIEVGCTFRFSDGSTQVVGPVSVRLSTGDRHPLMSSDSKKCVKSVFLAMKVTAASEPNPRIITADYPADPNKCMIYHPAVLGPKRFISQEDHAKGGSVGTLLQIE